MTEIQAVGLWVGLNVLLMFFLKGATGRTRAKTKVDFGAGDNEQMQRMMRVQGNAVAALGFMSAPLMLLHGLGGGLFVSRVLHAMGLGKSGGFSIGRVLGTIGTFLVFLIAGVSCIWFALH